MKNLATAIQDGIKAVGIGKKGSKALTPELIQGIVRELREGCVPVVVKGAFFGALIIKGVTAEATTRLQYLSLKAALRPQRAA